VYQEGRSALDEGEAVDDVGQEAVAAQNTERRRVVPGRALDPALPEQVPSSPERDLAFSSDGPDFPGRDRAPWEQDPSFIERAPVFREPQPAFRDQGQASAGLPRRQPMANMAPQLRADRSAAPKAPVAGGAGRSPEQARALMSSIQRGWRTGMTEAARDDGDDGQLT
jgi:hypothetical protein